MLRSSTTLRPQIIRKILKLNSLVLLGKTFLFFFSGTQRRGTCRIFLGPRFDERGVALNFRDQRSLMVEMDKFNVLRKYDYIFTV